MALISIISFANVGTGQIKTQNIAFLCFILFFISVACQTHAKPFFSKELNDLNLKANIVMMSTIFLGLFSSVCDSLNLQKTMMIVCLLINIYFLIVFFKVFFIVKFHFSKKKSKFIVKVLEIFEKCFKKGIINLNI